jgi:enamine deaminase RidA (YjgF/YER057c/UK114 family)
MSEFRKENHNYNAGWARDLFSDVAVVAGTPRLLFLSGVSSEDPDATDPMTVTIQGADFAEQCRIAFRKIKKLLAAEGATMNDIVRMTAYVTDAANIWTYFQIQGEELDGAPRPPHTFLQVAGLAAPQMQVEIEVTAVVAP